MKKTIGICFCLTVLFILILVQPGWADTIPSKEYPFPDGSDLPEILNVGYVLDCGDFSIRLIAQPLITKSMNLIVADQDWKYLVVRVGITNNSEETIGWLAPESFRLHEVYRNRGYGYYPLDYLMSAKASVGFSQKPYYAAISPGQTLQTPLVFSVFPDADSWIFTFSPRVYGSAPQETIQFRLPKALVQ